MYLITKWFGTFFYDKKGIKNKILFPKKPEEIMSRLQKIEKNEILVEEKKITNDKKVIVNEKRLQTVGDYKPDDPFFKEIEINPSDFGYKEDLLQKATVALTKNKIDIKLKSEDLQIVQMVNSLDDLIRTSNLLSERLDSWSLIPTPDKKMQPLINALNTIKMEINSLEKQIEEDIIIMAPNISTIIGPLIGARLISLAGGLNKLAMLPASTVQVLGAEKALFRYKKEGGKPPKHGVIYQHPIIKKASIKNRGKTSRIVSATIAIAAKADVFTKRDISKDLKDNMEKRIKNL